MAASVLVPIFYRLCFEGKVKDKPVKKTIPDDITNNPDDPKVTTVESRSYSRHIPVHVGDRVAGDPVPGRAEDRTTAVPGLIPVDPLDRRAVLERVLRVALSNRLPINPHKY